MLKGDTSRPSARSNWACSTRSSTATSSSARLSLARRSRAEAARFGRAQHDHRARRSRCKPRRSSSRKRTRWCRPKNNGGFAAHKLIDAVEAAIELPFARARARSAALRRARSLGAVGGAAPRVLRRTRDCGKIPGLRPAAPRDDCKRRRRRRRDDGHRHRDRVRAGRHSGRRDRQQRRSGRKRATDGHRHVHVPSAAGPPDARRGLEARAVDRLRTSRTSSPTPTSWSRPSSRIST